MKVLFLFVSLWLAYASGEETDADYLLEYNLKGFVGISHPKCNKSSKTTYFEYEHDCTKYYKCINGLAYLTSCAVGLLWTQETQRCQWASEVKCNISPTPPTPPGWTTAPPPGHTPPPHGHTTPPPGHTPTPPPSTGFPLEVCEKNKTSCIEVPNPKNCSEFFKCRDGYAYVVVCPNGLEFNQKIGMCDWPSTAHCKVPEWPCEDAYSKNTTIYKKDCTHYYLCSEGHPTLITCPIGYEFSEHLESCELACNVNCKEVTTTTTTEIPKPCYDGGIRNCKCDHWSTVLFPNIQDCSKYYKCHENLAYPRQCPHSLYFNIKTNRCDLPSVTQCGTKTNCMHGVENKHCPSCDNPNNPTLLPYPGNCSKYYECSDGIACPHDCPKDHEWSASKNRCDRSCDAHCSPQCEGGVQDSNCPINETPDYPTLLPYPGNCSKYYECSYGFACPKDCPKDQEWSASKNRCDRTCDAQCSVQCEGAIRNPNCPINGTPNYPTLLPYPGNCSKYFECSYGFACPKDCPKGEEWSASKNRCDLACDANCVVAIPCKGGLPSDKCPIDDDPMNPTHLPYPGDPTKYYKCAYGIACPQNCPGGLVWNVTSDRCDWTSTPLTPSPPTPSPPTPSPPNPSPPTPSPPNPSPQTPPTSTPKPCNGCSCTQEFTAYPGDCTKYYHCSNGKQYEQKCPSNLYWDSTTNACNYYQFVNCVQ